MDNHHTFTDWRMKMIYRATAAQKKAAREFAEHVFATKKTTKTPKSGNIYEAMMNNVQKSLTPKENRSLDEILKRQGQQTNFRIETKGPRNG